MKIMLGGSFVFANQLLKSKDKLEKLGHTVFVTEDLENCKNITEFKIQ